MNGVPQPLAPIPIPRGLLGSLLRGGRIATLTLFGIACSNGNDVLVGYNRNAWTGGTSTSAASTAGGGTSGGGASASGASGSGASIQLSLAGAQFGSTTATSPGTCDNGGPAIALPPLGGCTNDLAKRVFLFAVCTCTDFAATSVTTEPLRAAASGFNLGASIGVNGTYRVEGADSRLGGSLWVYGDAKFEQHDILGELVCGGSVTVRSASAVHRNADVLGDLSAPNLTIDGRLTISSSATNDVKSVGGGTQVIGGDVMIDRPCDCRNPIDVAGIAHHFKDDNDNARISLATAEFAANDKDLERTLPCGRYYFDSFGGTGAITLHITGKTLIAIGGQLSNSGGIALDLTPNAELDLFIAGNLELSGEVSLGNAERPSATRVYVAGQAALSTNLRLYANWYIPNSLLAMSAPSEFWGALYSNSLQSSGGLTVHYDDSVLDLPSCNPSGQSCNSCHDCANPTPACRNGRCETCQADSDCCPPLYCHQGTCQAAPYLI